MSYRRLLPALILVGALVTPATPVWAGAAHVGFAPSGASPSAPTRIVPDPRAAAYANNGVLNYGDAAFDGSATGPHLSAPIVGLAATPDGKGYWLVAADGGVFAYGDATFEGSAGSIGLYAPIVGMAPTPDGKGYWLVALDGGVFTFGDAQFYGSEGGHVLNSPIVGMASTHDGKGYWLAAADGGVFSFGDATFYGSKGGEPLNAAVVSIAASKDGHGYWLAAGDGGIFTFGDAPFEGSAGSTGISNSIAGMAVTPSGKGYWLAGGGGAVYWYGDAKPYGGNAGAFPEAPISDIAATADGGGYWLLEPEAFATTFSHPATSSAIVTAAASQVGDFPDAGFFCNPYGPCEEWCALFATWAWNAAGIPIPRFAFVGDIYTWAVRNTRLLSPDQRPSPGDAVLYGTGPATVATAVHTGIVAQVWPDGAIDTIEGDSGPGPQGHFGVNINGPFLPSHSLEYNGAGIFGFAAP